MTSPSDPTGRVFDPVVVRAVVEEAAAWVLFTIADEVYSRLTHDDYRTGILWYVDQPERVLTVEYCSKVLR